MFYSIRFQESPGKKKERERAGEKTGPTGNQFGSEGEHTTVALLIDEGHVRSLPGWGCREREIQKRE